MNSRFGCCSHLRPLNAGILQSYLSSLYIRNVARLQRYIELNHINAHIISVSFYGSNLSVWLCFDIGLGYYPYVQLIFFCLSSLLEYHILCLSALTIYMCDNVHALR